MSEINWLERLGKWRMVLTGRWLGTRATDDPQAKAARDLFDQMNCLRADVNALSRLLIDKKVITAEEFTAQIQDEAKWLCEQYEKTFPGFRATDEGMVIYDMKAGRETTKGWPA